MKKSRDKKSKPYQKGQKVENTDAMREKYGICDHYHVDYQSLEELNKVIFNRLITTEEAFKNLIGHVKELKKVVDALSTTCEDHNSKQAAPVAATG